MPPIQTRGSPSLLETRRESLRDLQTQQLQRGGVPDGPCQAC
jgi:hypothetical protein